MNTVPTRATIAELRQRAEQGTAKDQFSLGLMYYKGEGVPLNSVEADGFWRQLSRDMRGPKTTLVSCMPMDRECPKTISKHRCGTTLPLQT